MTPDSANLGDAAQRDRIDPQGCRAISRDVARMAKQVSGRGPLFVQTFCHGDVLVMLFRGFLTPAERAVADAGGVDTVKEMREGLFGSTREGLATLVEEQSGCGVEVTLYDVAPEHDVSAVVFVLEPEAE